MTGVTNNKLLFIILVDAASYKEGNVMPRNCRLATPTAWTD